MKRKGIIPEGGCYDCPFYHEESEERGITRHCLLYDKWNWTDWKRCDPCLANYPNGAIITISVQGNAKHVEEE